MGEILPVVWYNIGTVLFLVLDCMQLSCSFFCFFHVFCSLFVIFLVSDLTSSFTYRFHLIHTVSNILTSYHLFSLFFLSFLFEIKLHLLSLSLYLIYILSYFLTPYFPISLSLADPLHLSSSILTRSFVFVEAARISARCPLLIFRRP